MVFCTKCGTENPDDAKFCWRCSKTVFQPSAPRGKPSTLLIVTNLLLLGVIQGSLIFIIPVFDAMFMDFGAKLPRLTGILIAVSHFWKSWWWAINSVAYLLLYFAINAPTRINLRLCFRITAVVQAFLILLMLFAMVLPIMQLGQVASGTQ